MKLLKTNLVKCLVMWQNSTGRILLFWLGGKLAWRQRLLKRTSVLKLLINYTKYYRLPGHVAAVHRNIQASMRRQHPCCRAIALTRGFNTKLYTV